MRRFDDCALDVEARELRRAGEIVHLEPQAFDLLVLLVDERQRVVPKSELLDRVWGDQFVSESALTTRIKEIRRATGDDGARQGVIANVRGRGYRFVASIADDAHGEVPDAALVGRDADVAGVRGRLAPGTVVTVVGPGGVGKSALARAVAALVDGTHRDGVAVVELDALAADDALDVVVARALGVSTEGGDRTRVVQAVRALDALLVLDGCEHLVAEVATLAAQLTGVGGRVAVLATSRERLGTSTEQVWPLLPLDPADARVLFERRAAAADPTFDGREGADAIGELVARLDHLPLAIEMAAARLGALTFDELQATVADNLGRLRSPDRAAPARQRTLASLADWSIELLESPERALLADAATFAGPFDALDLAAVAGVAPVDAADGLASLVERSLVVADRSADRTAHRLLATVRVAARAELEAQGRRADADERHARRIVAAAAEAAARLRTPAERGAVRRLVALTAELRVAHAWARRHDPGLAAGLSGHLHPFAYGRLWGEPISWVLAMQDDGGELDPRTALALAGDAAHRGDLALARTLLDPALHGDDPHLRWLALELDGDVAFYGGELDRVLETADQLDDLHATLGHAGIRAGAATARSLAHTYRGDPAAGLAELQRDLPPATDLAPADRAWLAYATGEAQADLDPEAAAIALEAAVELGASVDHRYVEGVARTSLASLHARRGDVPAALAAYRDVLEGGRRRGNLAHSVTAVRNLCELLVAIDEPEAAVTVLAALEGDGVRPSYGAERDRLDRALTAVTAAEGSATVAGWQGRGQRLSPELAIGLALDVVERRLDVLDERTG